MSDVQNIKIRMVAEGDFTQLDTSLNKLTASEIKLKDGLKQVDTQAKATNKTLQEETAKSSKAVNESGKSFDDLSSKVRSLSSQIPGAFHVEQVLGFAKATTTASAGVGTMSSAMGVLKYAIAATGIGALVLALISLTAYFTRTDEGAAKLDGIMRAMGAVVNILAKGFVFLGDKIFSAFEDPKQAIKDLGEFLYNNIINRFKAVIVLAEAAGEALKGNFKNASKLATDGLIQLGTGITNATDKLKEFGSEIANAADEGYKLGLAFDDLEDREREFSITQANTSKQINQLIIQSKNRTLAEKDRIAIIDQAGRLETELLNKTLGLAKERLALIIRENQSARDTGQLKDDQRQKEVDQINKITQLETESVLLQEKLQNRRDVLVEAAIQKRLALLKAGATAEENLYKEQYVKREISEEQMQEGIIQAQLDSLYTQKEYMKAMGRDTIDIDKSIQDLLVKQRSDADKETLKNSKEASDAKKKEWEDDFKFYSALSDKNSKDEEKKLKEAAALRASIHQQSQVLISTISNGFFALEKERLDNELQVIQYNQAQELAAVGENKQGQAAVNAKYAKEVADIKRRQAVADKEQAIFNISLSTIQAVAKASPVVPLMALAAAIGAAQLAFAIAKPIPKFYNKGTKGVPGADTTRDSVHAMLTPGEGVMPVDRMKEYRPAFDAIFDRKIPADLINSIALNPSILNGRSGGNDNSSLEKELKGLRKDLSKIKTFEVNFDAKGYKAYLKSADSKTEIENNYSRMS